MDLVRRTPFKENVPISCSPTLSKEKARFSLIDFQFQAVRWHLHDNDDMCTVIHKILIKTAYQHSVPS